MESINQQLFKSILPAAFKDTKRLKSVDGWRYSYQTYQYHIPGWNRKKQWFLFFWGGGSGQTAELVLNIWLYLGIRSHFWNGLRACIRPSEEINREKFEKKNLVPASFFKCENYLCTYTSTVCPVSECALFLSVNGIH
jgi:hypothetical protein